MADDRAIQEAYKRFSDEGEAETRQTMGMARYGFIKGCRAVSALGSVAELAARCDETARCHSQAYPSELLREAAAALRAACPTPPREEIAKLVDPEVFKARSDGRWEMPDSMWPFRLEWALKQADAILALFTHAGETKPNTSSTLDTAISDELGHPPKPIMKE